MEQNKVEKLHKIADKAIDKKLIFGCSVCITYKGESIEIASGNLTKSTPFFIASTTKLYITAIVLQLIEEELLSLKDPISKFIDQTTLKGLLILDGHEYSGLLTIEQLLAHTSGLPDYFEDIPKGGVSLLKQITEQGDREWSFEDAIEVSKRMKPHFRPGSNNKAHYSDTNYQLLGKIIELIENDELEIVLARRIFVPLKLRHTYFYTSAQDSNPVDIYYKNTPLHIPSAMKSFTADGGIVSTAGELNVFLQAFFKGKLFPQKKLLQLYQWNSVMFPLEYGLGIMRFKIPWFLSPFKRIPEMLGHSGLSGAFAFYVPENDCYLTGTVNQVHKPQISFRLMTQLLLATISKK